MVAGETLPAHVPERRTRVPPSVAIEFSIRGDLRYLAHLDELRLLTRALTRAGWPVAYSHGFNPQPRVRLPLPRSVMIASDCELALVELTERAAAPDLHASLMAALPAGCGLQRVIVLAERIRPHARRACYRVELRPEHAREVAPRIAELLKAEALSVERSYGPEKSTRTIDIRPFVFTVTLDGCTLEMWLTYLVQRSARPSEVLETLHLPADAYNHCVRRAAVEWDIELAGLEQWPACTERNTVGQEESGDAQA